MKYAVDRHFYSYFGGASKHEYKLYTNLLEAWDVYKRTKAYDFDYDDAWQYTYFHVIHDDSVALKPQRPHARSAWEWELIKSTIEAVCEEADEDACSPFEVDEDCIPFDYSIDYGLPF